MQQYMAYLSTDINETGPSLVIFLGVHVDQFSVVRFFLTVLPILTYIGALEMWAIIYALVLPDGLADSFKGKT